MVLSIKNERASELATELATLTGQTKTRAVIESLEARLQQVKSEMGGAELTAILEIGRRCAALPDLDPRSADEIIGYDEDGLW